MVSLRRRRLLGLCLGVRNSVLSPLPRLYESGNAPENASRRSNPVSVHPMPMDDTKPPLEVNYPSSGIVASNVSNSSPSKQQSNQPNISSSVSNSSKEQNTRPTIEREVKHKKQHWRRHMNNQDQCVLRGVYFKNMKWQAAIKVGKKQIHLGTVSSRGEAAHLYDRAAFMCGREPNFELPEEEKQQLKNFKWDEFLAMTRRATTSKRTRRQHGIGAGAGRQSEWGDEQGAEGFSASDDALESATPTLSSKCPESGLNSFAS